MRIRLAKNVTQALKGLNWELVQGGKHAHLRIDGILVTVMSTGHRPGYDRTDLTILKAIKAHVEGRGMKRAA